MAQTSALKSTAITNLDSSPVVANTAGEGGPARVKHVTAFITTVSADNAGSTYRLVRLPSYAIVKSIRFESAAMTGGKFNLSVYYSDSTTDGTSSANTGVIVPTTGDQFFASDIDAASAVGITDVTNESGNYTIDKRNKHLWDALGLTSDPGGFFDIVAVCHTTAVTTGALMGIEVTYCD
jgi:hypothetical protein